MADSTLIRGGALVTPEGQLQGDILLADGKIAAIGLELDADGARVVDAGGCVVLPGLLDPHTHVQLDTGVYRTPDNWEIGTRTAACGGVTTVIDFATQFPGQDVKTALAARLAEIGELAQIDYSLHMMLTALPEAAELDRWLGQLVGDGVPSVKVYTTYRPNYYEDDAALLRVLEAAGRQDVLVMVHCENDALVSAATGALVESGLTGLAHHGEARPALAEVEAAHRVLFLAEQASSRPEVYVVHCSASGTVEQVSQARAGGQAAYAETTPQHLLLNESLYTGPHPERGIMQPPLRAAEENERLWTQVQTGAVATIGTDHCDYTLAQKQHSPRFTETAGGVPGLETLLPLLATYGVGQGRISWSRLIELTSSNPARIFGLSSKGTLAPGRDADVVIYDPAGQYTIQAGQLHNLAGYTPFEGWPVAGRVRDVFSRGRTIVENGEFRPAPGWGRFQRAAGGRRFSA
jgi:dihydropyrimidinase